MSLVGAYDISGDKHFLSFFQDVGHPHGNLFTGRESPIIASMTARMLSMIKTSHRQLLLMQ